MKHTPFIFAVAFATMFAAPAEAGGFDRDQWRAKLAQIIKRLNAWTPPRASTETVSCSGAGGVTVSFSTFTANDRQLAGPVRVKIGAQTTVVPALLVTTYANRDHGIEMQANKALSSAELLAFRTELAPTASPQTDEVATYAGTVSVNGGADREVTCSAFRQGAGVLKPQTPKPPAGPTVNTNFAIACSRAAAPAAPIVTFEAASNHSRRLVSDVNETRASDDSEMLPAYLVSQFVFNKAGMLVELDDGSAEGAMIARLKLDGVRVPTNQPAADPAIYGVWSGTYRRFDAGRELNEAVNCYAF